MNVYIYVKYLVQFADGVLTGWNSLSVFVLMKFDRGLESKAVRKRQAMSG